MDSCCIIILLTKSIKKPRLVRKINNSGGEDYSPDHRAAHQEAIQYFLNQKGLGSHVSHVGESHQLRHVSGVEHPSSGYVEQQGATNNQREETDDGAYDSEQAYPEMLMAL